MTNASEEEMLKLIPVYLHRYAPYYPDIIEVPVFSV